MKTHEFFAKYANLPLSKRFIVINMTKYGQMTISDVFKSLKRLEERMRPLKIEESDLLEIAEEYFKRDES